MFYLTRRILLTASKKPPWARTFGSVEVSDNVVTSNESFIVVPLRPTKGKSSRTRSNSFVDWKSVTCRGGNGGDGKISFLSVFVVEFAGPDGGDGGNGGHVVFEAGTNYRDLSHVPSRIVASSGGQGGHNDMAGKDAAHRVIQVPLGTLLRNREGEIVGDLDTIGSRFLAAKGGAGGKGNAHFKTSVRQAPNIAEAGGGGELLEYSLELRCMADVGLIGFPNAGKSTLLSAISRARPKVASYPFTTLAPHVGMVQYSDLSQVAVADLPGLLPGAHRNHGLGLAFLRHAERCSILVYVIDMGEHQPHTQLKQLRYELDQYKPGLGCMPQVVIANKVDLEEAQEEEKLSRLEQEAGEGITIIPVSGKYGRNIAKLLNTIKSIKNEFDHACKERG